MSKSEGFAFKVEPESLSIVPNQHKYVTVFFSPTEMKQYGGVFEAIVQNGELNPKQGKMVFELRGEGTLPTLGLRRQGQTWCQQQLTTKHHLPSLQGKALEPLAVPIIWTRQNIMINLRPARMSTARRPSRARHSKVLQRKRLKPFGRTKLMK